MKFENVLSLNTRWPFGLTSCLQESKKKKKNSPFSKLDETLTQRPRRGPTVQIPCTHITLIEKNNIWTTVTTSGADWLEAHQTFIPKYCRGVYLPFSLGGKSELIDRSDDEYRCIRGEKKEKRSNFPGRWIIVILQTSRYIHIHPTCLISHSPQAATMTAWDRVIINDVFPRTLWRDHNGDSKRRDVTNPIDRNRMKEYRLTVVVQSIYGRVG